METKSANRKSSGRGGLPSLSLAILLAALGTSIANVGLPTLSQAFDASFQDVQWVVLAYLLAMTTLIVGIGRLADSFGRKRLLLVGLGLFTLGSLLCGIAPTLPLLVAARALQGLGAASMMSLPLAFVSETVATNKTGRVMGMLGSLSALGTALGPSLGGALIVGFGWRALFLVSVPLGVATFLIAARTLPADRLEPTATRPRFDRIGTLVLAATLATYALATTLGGGRFGILNMALLTASILGLGLFAWIEGRVESPLIRLALLRESRLNANLATNALVSSVMMATLIVGPFYLVQALSLDTALVGGIMAIGPIISAVSGIPAGRSVDRWGAPAIGLVGLGTMILGAVGLVVLPPLFGLMGYSAAIAFLTPGYQLFQAANNTAVMQNVRADQRGLVASLLTLSRNLGLITGASLMGALFAWAAATADIMSATPDAVVRGLQITFIVAAGLLSAALIFAARDRMRATPVS